MKLLKVLTIAMLILLVQFPHKAHSQGTHYIYKLPYIIREPGTYILKENTRASGDGIIIKISNVILDGDGHKIIGNHTGTGVLLESSNILVRNIRITGFEWGIKLRKSSSSIIYNSRISRNWYGIYLSHSSGDKIYNNTISNNWIGVYLDGSLNNIVKENKFYNDGMFVLQSYNNTIVSNTINNRPLVYLEGVNNYTIGYAGQVILVKCNKITINNLKIYNVTVGIELENTRNSRISGNNISNNGVGMYLEQSSSNRIYNNTISNNGDGIDMESSSRNIIYSNNISRNLDSIDLYRSSDNKIYHNNFVNNRYKIESYYSANIWDNGYPSGGNYWSDYKGNDNNRDGIGDTPYVIDKNNSDRYPLMKPFRASLNKDFSLSANYTNITIENATAKAIVLKIISINGYSGNISLSYSWINAPSGVSVEIDPNEVNVPSNGYSISYIKILAKQSSSIGSYYLKITAIDGKISHSLVLNINIKLYKTMNKQNLYELILYFLITILLIFLIVKGRKRLASHKKY